MSTWTSANLLSRRARAISEEGRSTFSDQVSGEIGKVMVICKSEHTSIYGLVVFQSLRRQYGIYQRRIAAFSCNPPYVKWIRSHCAEAQ